jgi:dolichyl-phosphate-mannose-protein mannosyltransferase
MSDQPTAAVDDPPDVGAVAAPARPRWLWAVVLPLAVVLAAGAVRYHQLGQPARCYFDETYYYYDAREYLQFGTEQSFAVHPPVGKWLIAAGLAVFGVDADDPLEQAITVQDDDCLTQDDEEENPPVRAREAADAFARRAMSALAGTGAVAVTYFIGLRLFRRRSAALLGAALLATDGLAVTMSRISMLDVFLQLFVALGVLAILIDRDRLWAGAPPHPPVSDVDDPVEVSARPRPGRGWLWVAGLAFGLAIATKWSGLAALGLAGLWVAASELWWRRRVLGRWTRGLLPAVARTAVALVLVPAAVYLVSYTGWFANHESTRKAADCPTPAAAATTAPDVAIPPTAPDAPTTPPCRGLDGVATVVAGWWEEQGEIYRFHRDLEADHPYRAPAWTWLLMTRPVAYYYESCPADGPDDGETCDVAPGTVAEVLGMGNPALWWMALLGYPVLLWAAAARRSWPAATIALFLFGQSVPYVLSPRPVFLFYLTPVVPFIALALAWLCDEALDSESMRWVPATATLIALAGFAFYAPIFLGLEIPRPVWDALILFESWI